MLLGDEINFTVIFFIFVGVMALIGLLRAASGAQDIRKRREFELSGKADKLNQGCAIVILIALAIAAFVFFQSQ